MSQKKIPDAALNGASCVKFATAGKDSAGLSNTLTQEDLLLCSKADAGPASPSVVERLNLLRYLPSLHDAAMLLAQIGARL